MPIPTYEKAPDGRAYAVDEFYKTETTDEQLAEAAKDMQ